MTGLELRVVRRLVCVVASIVSSALSLMLSATVSSGNSGVYGLKSRNGQRII